MNIVFYLFIIVIMVFLWFVLAFLFKPLGRLFYRLWDDAKKEMNCEDNKNEKKN